MPPAEYVTSPMRQCEYCLNPFRQVRHRRFCSDECRQGNYNDSRLGPPITWRDCIECGDTFFILAKIGSNGRRICSEKCSQRRNAAHYARRYDPAKERTKRDKRMRAISLAHTDLTAEHITQLYRKAKRCPLCKVPLTRTTYAPDCAELDHIVPVNVGGTHTIGNVRIICRLCNLQRPKDGSDALGLQPTLWACDLAAAATIAASVQGQRREAQTRARIERLAAEERERWLRKTHRRIRAARAINLRQQGMSWVEAGRRLGFTSPQSAAQRYFPAEAAIANETPRQPQQRVVDRTRYDRITAMRKAGVTWSAIAHEFNYANKRSASRCYRDMRRRHG